MPTFDITVLTLPVQLATGLGAAKVASYNTRVRQMSDHMYVATPLQRRSVTIQPDHLFRVRGTVRVTPDLPVARMVYLYDEDTFQLWGRTLSDPVTGAFEFRFVPGFLTYTAMSVAHKLRFRF
jgi:hypothetical protein